MDLQIKDMVALVTGASVGIGTGIVKVLAEEGCKLIITAPARRSAQWSRR